MLSRYLFMFSAAAPKQLRLSSERELRDFPPKGSTEMRAVRGEKKAVDAVDFLLDDGIAASRCGFLGWYRSRPCQYETWGGNPGPGSYDLHVAVTGDGPRYTMRLMGAE